MKPREKACKAGHLAVLGGSLCLPVTGQRKQALSEARKAEESLKKLKPVVLDWGQPKK